MNKAYIFVLLQFVVCVTSNVLRNEKENDFYRLDIIHYNDFHASFEEVSLTEGVCFSNDTKCFGGFARLYYEIQVLLHAKPGALVLNAGDTFQGTYWYTLMRWNVTQHFINMIPNDAHALGNHEFDNEVPGLVPYIKALNSPVVAANLVTSTESELHGLYQPYLKIEKRGRKIGIIGLITEKTGQLSNSVGVNFLDPVVVAREKAQELTDQGVEIIIILSHGGLESEIRIAKEAGDNIDIIVGGHSHTLLFTGETPTNETAAGNYPLVIESETKPGHKVLIVTASSITKYLGNLTAYFDGDGELQSFDGAPVFLNRSIPEDPQIKALMKPYSDELHQIVDVVTGYTSEDLDRDSCSYQECQLASIVADSYIYATKLKNISNLPHISLIIRSMIRSGISKGNITVAKIINMSSFKSKIVTYTLKGKHIAEALSLAYHKDNIGQYFAHFGGIKIEVNGTTGEVTSILVKDGDFWSTLDTEQEYQFITTMFLTNRGIFTKFKEHKGEVTFVGTDYEVIGQYIRTITPISPQIDHRLEFI